MARSQSWTCLAAEGRVPCARSVSANSENSKGGEEFSGGPQLCTPPASEGRTSLEQGVKCASCSASTDDRIIYLHTHDGSKVQSQGVGWSPMLVIRLHVTCVTMKTSIAYYSWTKLFGIPNNAASQPMILAFLTTAPVEHWFFRQPWARGSLTCCTGGWYNASLILQPIFSQQVDWCRTIMCTVWNLQASTDVKHPVL